jgi:hypothetical protein
MILMRWSRSLFGLAALMLLLAAPAYAAGSLKMNCPRCDHVDVEGHGLEPNTTLTLLIRDVRSGQQVIPETKITTDGSGSFAGEYDVDLTKHPLLLGSVYDQAGTDLELAAHTRAQALTALTEIPHLCSPKFPSERPGGDASLTAVGGRHPLA